jgi:hypothetical protein
VEGPSPTRWSFESTPAIEAMVAVMAHSAHVALETTGSGDGDGCDARR